jgi:LruC domain-containing protein
MSDNNLPWAINIPVQFAYPAEKQDITKGFLNFNRWATSKGTTNADWYLDKVGYRDTSKLFKK